jgi:catechol 2,3-dioxygenase-like lactoylglutathione lyase family enzyme
MISNILVTIPTGYLDESIAFYTGVLGFSIERRLDRPGGVTLVFLVNSGFTVELVAGAPIPVGEVGKGAPLLTFLTPNFSEITSRLSAKSIPCPQPIDLPGGMSMLRFTDPNGVVISFVSGDL